MRFAYFIFALTLIIQPIGQILERKGMATIGTIDGFSQLFSPKTLVTIVTNPYIIAGVGCSVTGLLLWLGVLSHFKVSYIYPLGSLSYIVVTVLAITFLQESMTWTRMGGVCLVIAGCFLININV